MHAIVSDQVDEPLRLTEQLIGVVLRRVEHGERLRVTNSGRPVAKLRPLSARPQSLAWDPFFRDRDRWQADPRLAQESELLPETTDDIPIP